MRSLIARNRNIVAAGVLVAGLVSMPAVVQAAPAATVTVTGSGTATCPAGYAATGGGFTVPADRYGNTSSRETRVLSSAPVNRTGWRVTAEEVVGNYSSVSGWRYTKSSYAARVEVICVK